MRGLLVAVAALATVACGNVDLGKLTGRKAAAPTPTRCEGSGEATDKDVAYALGYTGQTLTGPEWTRGHESGNQRATVTWNNGTEGAVARLEYVVYACGYTPADLHEYFSEQNFRTVFFQQYQKTTQIATCASGARIKLYELTAEYEGRPYVARYWRVLDSPTRIVAMMMSFPAERKASLDAYSRALFPALTACRR